VKSFRLSFATSPASLGWSSCMGVLSSFHPAVRSWFDGRFPHGPSPPQISGWPAIRRRENTLIAAPTGSGKTLAAFLVCIDEFYHQALPLARFGCGEDEPFRLDPNPSLASSGSRSVAKHLSTHSSTHSSTDFSTQRERPKGVEVLYISPLKALAVDIQENLSTPLAEIEALARSMGLPVPEIRIGMRSGDTSASARAALLM
jgi:ATP-dependent Lhr-like helicase